MKTIIFFIDKEKFTVTEENQLVSELLSNYAKEDPSETTLVLKKGNDLTKLSDDAVIELENGMHFVVFHDGPTTVSYHGADKIMEELIDLGFKPERIKASDSNDYIILREYAVQLGKFSGKIIDLGIMATADFPISVASAIHIKSTPQLYEKTDTVPNVRNITDSKLGPEWRYWSINFHWVNGQSVRRLISQINTVFQNA